MGARVRADAPVQINAWQRNGDAFVDIDEAKACTAAASALPLCGKLAPG